MATKEIRFQTPLLNQNAGYIAAPPSNGDLPYWGSVSIPGLAYDTIPTLALDAAVSVPGVNLSYYSPRHIGYMGSDNKWHNTMCLPMALAMAIRGNIEQNKLRTSAFDPGAPATVELLAENVPPRRHNVIKLGYDTPFVPIPAELQNLVQQTTGMKVETIWFGPDFFDIRLFRRIKNQSITGNPSIDYSPYSTTGTDLIDENYERGAGRALRDIFQSLKPSAQGGGVGVNMGIYSRQVLANPWDTTTVDQDYWPSLTPEILRDSMIDGISVVLGLITVEEIVKDKRYKYRGSHAVTVVGLREHDDGTVEFMLYDPFGQNNSSRGRKHNARLIRWGPFDYEDGYSKSWDNNSSALWVVSDNHAYPQFYYVVDAVAWFRIEGTKFQWPPMVVRKSPQKTNLKVSSTTAIRSAHALGQDFSRSVNTNPLRPLIPR
ncbi:hypothetical protein [Sorangium sp. So ce861]|uniref:hypothetical protein n=1 Tax=Sorangium sp. So ce861 TaxID=3133323 RepID=UPI003F6171E3